MKLKRVFMCDDSEATWWARQYCSCSRHSQTGLKKVSWTRTHRRHTISPYIWELHIAMTSRILSCKKQWQHHIVKVRIQIHSVHPLPCAQHESIRRDFQVVHHLLSYSGTIKDQIQCKFIKLFYVFRTYYVLTNILFLRTTEIWVSMNFWTVQRFK